MTRTSSLFGVLLAACVLSAATGHAAPARTPVVVFLPPQADDALRPLALLLEARAAEQVELTGGVGVLHLKQALRVVQEEGVPSTTADADRLRALLGADRALFFSLSPGAPLQLAWSVVDGKGKPVTGKAPVGTTWSQALEQGGALLARALLGKAPSKALAQPSSTHDDALQPLGRCYATVLRQPLSVDTPSLLDTSELEAAIADCRLAVKADASLSFASATLALAQAILGADADAARTLATLPPTAGTLEVYTLARFWLLTRYQSNEAGAAFLRDVIAAHPAELLPRTYLGDTQLAVGAWGDAEATFRELTALMPASPWAAGRLSKALARQGKHDEALVAAKHALDLSPTSLEARLEYGSRLIDAGKVADAVTQLQPLASAPAARGEHLLRLGWAQWLLGNVEGAGASFEKALAVSTLPGDWRTKGRASYDLALVEAKRGKPDAARAALRVALQTGLKLRTVDPLLATAARELERAEASPDAGGALALKPTVLPREASLFPVDTFGDVDPAAKKPPPPEGLVLGRF